MVGLGVLGVAMIGSAFMVTETNRRRRIASGNVKVLASSVFFLVAISIPTFVSAFVPSSLLVSNSISHYCDPCYYHRRTTRCHIYSNPFAKESNESWLHQSTQLCFAPDTKASLSDIQEEKTVLRHEKQSVAEFDRRLALQSLGLASLLLSTAALAAESSAPTPKSLDDLRFGNGQWSPLKDEDLCPNDPEMSSFVPASFATYLTRFLINYDEGVSSWWKNLQHAYSLLPEDQQQNRLGQDFGKFAASVQRSIQEFLEKQGRVKSARLAYEQIFERLVASSAGSEDEDEVSRQLMLLASILPSRQQPKEFMRKQSLSALSRSSASANDVEELGTEEALSFMKEDFAALLPRPFAPTVSEDGSVALPSSIKLYEVGIGEEFGQAATATAFGPLASVVLTRDLPNYSFDVYALFGISGAAGCCLTHSLVIPLDVVKTKEQVWSTEGYKANIVTGAKRILQEEGMSGLLTGAQATLAGYFWYGLSVYPSYAFFKRYLAHEVLSADLATSHVNDIALVAGALAAVIASLGLTPLEAARIRVVADPARYRPLGLIGTLQVIAAEGGGAVARPWQNLYAGLPSLLTRQVIFGSVKFLAFERACEFIYHVWPFLRDATWTSLSVSLVAGGFSGALSSVVSQPADAVLTYVAAMEQSVGLDGSSSKSSLGVLEGSRLMIEEGGVTSLFRGLGSRCLWAAAIIAGQFLLYDIFRNYFGVNSEDLSQVFRIDLQ